MVRFSMGLWIRWVAALAAAYAVTGWLSTRLAISPGYATAIFPPAGIALVALLTGGNSSLARRLAGVIPA